MDIATFRQTFPEFASIAAYPDASIQLQITIAGKRLPADRWDDLLDTGTGLFVAHNLVVNKQNAGKQPGEVKGPATAKAVDKVSVSRDPSLVALTDGGYWNLTNYGIQFLQLARLVGMGGMQL